MPFERPTLTALRTAVRADIASALPSSDALLRFSNLGIVGDVMAALANGHYGYLDYIARQAVPFTATDEYLEGWAALHGVTRKPATAAAGQVAFSGTNGSVIPAGTPMSRADGVAFRSTADATVASGTTTVSVVAVATGADGEAPAGVPMTLSSGVAGVQSTGLTTTPLTGGADVEGDDAFRSRMLLAYAAPPQGGAASDFVEWALAVPGVTRAWVVRGGRGAGSVVILFMMDDAEAAYGGIPQGTNGVSPFDSRDVAATGDQLAVVAAIWPLQPVTALVYASAPVANTITLTIAGLTGATVAVQNAIRAAVVAALRANAQPGGVTYSSAIEGAIAAVPGSAGFVLTAIAASAGTVGPGFAGNITSNPGALPILGGITYV
ncbi:MAG: baseplate J/gp47 family protein [Sphingomonadaceae bacterium]|nr:baseplate J/gp47 family protein [Sphingomonadaceae bacterium]